MGYKYPVSFCNSCNSENTIEFQWDLIYKPAGFGRKYIQEETQIRFIQPNIPVIYSDIEWRFCGDCDTFTSWFMAKYSREHLFGIRDHEDEERSEEFYKSHPEIEPRCLKCQGTNLIANPKCKCDGELELLFKDTGLISLDIEFTNQYYLPDGSIAIGII